MSDLSRSLVDAAAAQVARMMRAGSPTPEAIAAEVVAMAVERLDQEVSWRILNDGEPVDLGALAAVIRARTCPLDGAPLASVRREMNEPAVFVHVDGTTHLDRMAEARDE